MYSESMCVEWKLWVGFSMATDILTGKTNCCVFGGANRDNPCETKRIFVASMAGQPDKEQENDLRAQWSRKC